MTSSVMIESYLWHVRASRLVGLLGLLQARGRMTAAQLAAEGREGREGHRPAAIHPPMAAPAVVRAAVEVRMTRPRPA